VEAAALIPIKSFGAAKRRLTGWLTDEQRRDLARWMAARVLAAAAPLPTFVACDDEDVASWAEQQGAFVLWGPGLGLNGAIDHGVDTLAGKGFDTVLISHGDLPLATHLVGLLKQDAITIVPDLRGDGTNVLVRPTNLRFPARYGATSFQRHLAAAIASGLPITVRRDRRLALDVDTVLDCRHPTVAPLLAPIVVFGDDRHA
jgi:2-phospho-L-lactate/phosphoenolpyruvate guanylyltransferase